MAVYFQPADRYSVRNVGVLALGNALGTAIDSLIKGQIEHNVKARENSAWQNYVANLNPEEYRGLAPELATAKLIQQKGFGALTPNQQKNAFTMLQGFNSAWDRDNYLNFLKNGGTTQQYIADNLSVAEGNTPVQQQQQNFIGSGKTGINLPLLTYYAHKAGIPTQNISTLQDAMLDKMSATAVDTGDQAKVIGYSPISGATKEMYSAQKQVAPNTLAQINAEMAMNKDRMENNLKVAGINAAARASGWGYGDQGYAGLVRLTPADLQEAEQNILKTAETDPQEASAMAQSFMVSYLPKNDAAIAWGNNMLNQIERIGGKTSKGGKTGGKVVTVQRDSHAQNRNKKK